MFALKQIKIYLWPTESYYNSQTPQASLSTESSPASRQMKTFHSFSYELEEKKKVGKFQCRARFQILDGKKPSRRSSLIPLPT